MKLKCFIFLQNTKILKLFYNFIIIKKGFGLFKKKKRIWDFYNFLLEAPRMEPTYPPS